MKVDFYSTADIPVRIKDEYFHAFRSIVDADSLIEGKACRKFEEEFSHYLNIKYALGVGNGFDAIRIGLLAIGIKPGDKIALPAHTFIATWYAVESIGAIPVGIDVDVRGQIDLDLLEKQTSVACVIPVHMHGTHCDMRRLTNWARQHKILVLEDCAQAAGLDIQGKKAGTWGDLAAFSFYPTKNLFALGDGGAICTNNIDFLELARLHSRYGSDKNDKYKHIRVGQNSRLDTVQAAFLSINLQYLDEWNLSRIKIANAYNENLPKHMLLEANEAESIFHHFVIQSQNRDNLRNELMKHQIGTDIHYPNLAAVESDKNLIGHYKKGEYIACHTLSLPMSPWQNSQHTEYVIHKINEASNGI